jgi:hypothetical protein
MGAPRADCPTSCSLIQGGDGPAVSYAVGADDVDAYVGAAGSFLDELTA